MPNILLITTDQQRRDSLGCYGNPVCRTPNLDTLASGGLRFTECYVNNPLCMPNRSTLLTGRHVNAHRVRTNGRSLDPREVTFPQLLGQAGYRTGAFGKMHFTSVQPADPPPDYPRADWWEYADECAREGFFGFDEVAVGAFHGGGGRSHVAQWQKQEHPDTYHLCRREHALATSPHDTPEAWHSAQPVEAHPNRFVTEKTIDFIRRNADESFFCWASYPDPHHPYNPPEPYCTMYDPAQVMLGPRLEGELDNKPPHVREQVDGKIKTGGTAQRPTFTEEQLREVFA
ncbi:MAG: sulfatase, partial [Planctomycetota bacterium]